MDIRVRLIPGAGVKVSVTVDVPDGPQRLLTSSHPRRTSKAHSFFILFIEFKERTQILSSIPLLLRPVIFHEGGFFENGGKSFIQLTDVIYYQRFDGLLEVSPLTTLTLFWINVLNAESPRLRMEGIVD